MLIDDWVKFKEFLSKKYGVIIFSGFVNLKFEE